MRRLRDAILLLLIVSFAVGCQRRQPPREESAAVYTAYLSSFVSGSPLEEKRKEPVLIQDSTLTLAPSAKGLDWFLTYSDDIDGSTKRQFKRVCAEAILLESRFVPPVGYAFATKSDIDGGKVRTEYGVIRFSRVGFNNEVTEALFVMDYTWAKCRSYGYVLMKKDRTGKWVLGRSSGLPTCL